MSVRLEKNVTGFKDARQLKMVVQHSAQTDATDKPTRLLIESIIEQIQTCVADPQFGALAKETSVDDSGYRLYEDSPGLLSGLFNSIRGLGMPTKKEILLSKQRQELLERAERAEAMAFESLAETEEIARERDALKEQIKSSG